MPPPAPTFWKKVDENQVCYFIWPYGVRVRWRRGASLAAEYTSRKVLLEYLESE